jgi:hypothetical protein
MSVRPYAAACHVYHSVLSFSPAHVFFCSDHLLIYPSHDLFRSFSWTMMVYPMFFSCIMSSYLISFSCSCRRSNVFLMCHLYLMSFSCLMSAYLCTVLFMRTSRVSLPIYLMSTSCMSIFMSSSFVMHVYLISFSCVISVYLTYFSFVWLSIYVFLLCLAVYLTSFSCVMSVYIMSCPVLCFLPSFLLIYMSCPSN